MSSSLNHLEACARGFAAEVGKWQSDPSTNLASILRSCLSCCQNTFVTLQELYHNRESAGVELAFFADWVDLVEERAQILIEAAESREALTYGEQNDLGDIKNCIQAFGDILKKPELKLLLSKRQLRPAALRPMYLADDLEHQLNEMLARSPRQFSIGAVNMPDGDRGALLRKLSG